MKTIETLRASIRNTMEDNMRLYDFMTTYVGIAIDVVIVDMLTNKLLCTHSGNHYVKDDLPNELYDRIVSVVKVDNEKYPNKLIIAVC